MRARAVGMRAVFVWTIGSLAGCRFGGPSADPNAVLALPDEAGDNAAIEDATVAAPDDGSGDDAPVTGNDAAATDAEVLDDGGDGAPEAAAPVPPCGKSVAVCDPIRGTGCNPLQQCDVDPGQSSTPTGLCVFGSAMNDGGACSSSVVNESCPPQSTCVATVCRRVCLCDSDCLAGDCCTDAPGGTGAFRLCRACAP